MINYDSDGSIDWKYTYEYDEEGNKVEYIRYDSDGILTSKNNFRYDEKGNLAEVICYDSDEFGLLVNL